MVTEEAVKKFLRIIREQSKESEETEMKHKPGDKVKVRKWKDMKKQYGVTKLGKFVCIKNPNNIIRFMRKMRRFCGKVVTIASCDYASTFYEIVKCRDGHIWADWMFEN